MSDCKHPQLVLVPKSAAKVRCKHCHLTMSKEELGEQCCPECLAERGVRHYDFEELKQAEDEPTVYRCETCPLTIECPD